MGFTIYIYEYVIKSLLKFLNLHWLFFSDYVLVDIVSTYRHFIRTQNIFCVSIKK
jgi:hypothetical protein